MSSKRIGDILERYFKARVRYADERQLLMKTILVLLMSLGFITMRMALFYLILVKIEAGKLLWVLFWAQIPFVVFLDLLEKLLLKRRWEGRE